MTFIGPLLTGSLRQKLILSAKNARYRQKNPEKERVRTKAVFAAWRERNREYDIARSKRWYEQNRERHNASRRARRGELKFLPT